MSSIVTSSPARSLSAASVPLQATELRKTESLEPHRKLSEPLVIQRHHSISRSTSKMSNNNSPKPVISNKGTTNNDNNASLHVASKKILLQKKDGLEERDKENYSISNEDEIFEVFNPDKIASLPMNKLLEMLTTLLETIIQSNDNINNVHPLKMNEIPKILEHDSTGCLNAMLSFKGKHIPQINLEQYFKRIQKYCPTTNDVFLSLLIYFDRIFNKCNSKFDNYGHDNPQIFVMDSYNIHRLIIAGVTVSTKFLSDFFYSNSRYAKVGGISLKELNYLELQFLILCDFNLLISIEEYERYANLLYRFYKTNTN
ncbi:hypothetical protein KAFR_0L00880 [Kazachstania africana CBS 2517]|uniref:Cyclin n=1 Tax=Kazachstania africana (strain ATCC 22294 / BCRC 22015 / CBS 2517 / CECT 1963 / NBRC 1671 / NRRL Y-8276) TaxID=1071382 RepID=H2B246_KAZAF|nr:hypothetical protein KAFR_0L00880 [Kazachstania africana CBS 2517]CCF60696.1 hypothetical protein KAFR_0L00880 [Kazachstania africana CBS 2517]